MGLSRGVSGSSLSSCRLLFLAEGVRSWISREGSVPYPQSFVSLDGWYTSEPRPLLVAFSHRNIGKMRLKITIKLLFLFSLTLFFFFLLSY